MLPPSPDSLPQSSFFDIANQLDASDPLLALGRALDWDSLETAFGTLYSDVGRSAKPIRLMCGLLMFKQLHNLSDESVVEQWCMIRITKFFAVKPNFKRRFPVTPLSWSNSANALGLRE